LHRLAARGIAVLVSTHYMDEAERCHKLAYIAYGKLLAQGTAQQVVDSQHLSTWAVFGGNLVGLSERLRVTRGVEQTVSFGAALHVSGTDEASLGASLEALAVAEPSLRIQRIDTGLDDAFVYMMSRSADNYAATGSSKR